MPDVHVPATRSRRPALGWALPGVAVLVALAVPLKVATTLGMGITAAGLCMWAGLAGWSLFVRGPLPAALCLLAPLGATPFWDVPLAELDGAARDTVGRARDRGLAALSDGELGAWFDVHALAAVGAYVVGFPEAASVAWAARSAGPDERWFDGAFALADPRVRREVTELLAHPELQPHPISWPDHDREPRAPRVVAALDCPAYPSATPGGVVLRCRVDVGAHTPVVLARANGHRLTFDAGVFHLLEERGLLHPYTAAFQVDVAPGDPRLAPDAPMPVGLREVTAATVYAMMAGD